MALAHKKYDLGAVDNALAFEAHEGAEAGKAGYHHPI
jgi:hypothetical protein